MYIRGGVFKLAKTRRKRTKTNTVTKHANVSADIKIVIMIVLSILLAILIYTESGYIGENLSPMLGGICGLMKYIIPIGTFGIAIYLACDDKKYINYKLLQYGGILLCIAAILSIYQISIGNIDSNLEFGELLVRCYELRRKKFGWRSNWNISSVSFYKANWNTWYRYFATWACNYICCTYIWF